MILQPSKGNVLGKYLKSGMEWKCMLSKNFFQANKLDLQSLEFSRNAATILLPSSILYCN